MGQLASEVTEILDYKKNKKAARAEKKEIRDQMEIDEKNKTNLVKKALAAQRAKYGAGGMSNKGMTEEAVLKRLREETEEPFEEKKRANLNKLKKIKVEKPNLLKKLVSRFDEFIG